jgi:hypothetical protein
MKVSYKSQLVRKCLTQYIGYVRRIVLWQSTPLYNTKSSVYFYATGYMFRHTVVVIITRYTNKIPMYVTTCYYM